MKFRGSVKRRLARFSAGATVLPSPASRLLGHDDQPVGTVLMAEHASEARIELLVVLNIGADFAKLAEAPELTLERAALSYDCPQ